MKNYIYLLFCLLNFEAYGQDEPRIAYWAPFYTATKDINGQTVVLKILGTFHPLSSKVIPEDVLAEIYASDILVSEIDGTAFFEREEKHPPSPSEIGNTIEIVDLIDQLFSSKNLLSPEKLKRNFEAAALDDDPPDFEDEYRWTTALCFDNQLKLMQVIKKVLTDLNKKNYLEILAQQGLDCLNPSVLVYLLKYELDEYKPTQPAYQLDFHLQATMDAEIYDFFLSQSKNVFCLENDDDRLFARSLTKANETAIEIISKMSDLLIQPKLFIKNIRQNLDHLAVTTENNTITAFSYTHEYPVCPAPVNAYDEDSEKYFSGDMVSDNDTSLIYRNKLWCSRLIKALAANELPSHKIALTVGCAHLVGESNFLQLLAEEGFEIKNCTRAARYCPPEYYQDNFYN